MQIKKAMAILLLSSGATLIPALAQTSGTTMTARGPVPSAVNTKRQHTTCKRDHKYSGYPENHSDHQTRIKS
jgi:hypothetical protein